MDKPLLDGVRAAGRFIEGTAATRQLQLGGGVLFIAALMAGCVYVDDVRDTVLPARIDYSCAGNKVLPVSRAPDQKSAAVLLDGKWVALARADSAAQEKYSDGTYSLYLHGERAMLERQGRVVYGPCTSPVDLPTARRSR